jgi:hypothetical protein
MHPALVHSLFLMRHWVKKTTITRHGVTYQAFKVTGSDVDIRDMKLIELQRLFNSAGYAVRTVGYENDYTQRTFSITLYLPEMPVAVKGAGEPALVA